MTPQDQPDELQKTTPLDVFKAIAYFGSRLDEFQYQWQKDLMVTLLSAAKQLGQVEKERDEEIGEFQNQVRDLIMKLAPSCNPDGGGCESGDWRDFTL